ncbi:MAG: triose-phosphate isomerase [Synergistaceae bacterium]|nr:triose-phosphate isomerase [Synergistaceae bacterium]
MSKKIYLYGNWKMNMTAAETEEFFKNFNYASDDKVDIAVFPPFTSIWAAHKAAGSGVHIGAQNCYVEPKGAFTGEVAIGMLKECGVSHVILGHSERRHIFGESDELVAKKVKACLDNDLVPVFCYGEKLEEREAGKTFDVMERQIKAALNGLTPEEISKIIYAYEPVWAIGTGKAATSAQAEEVCAWSKKLINEIAGKDVKPVVLYGGSVKPNNSKELLSMDAIDGALVGGASLKPDTFIEIYNAYAK